MRLTGGASSGSLSGFRTVLDDLAVDVRFELRVTMTS